MKKLLCTLFFVGPFASSFAQQSTVTFIRIKPSPRLFNTDKEVFEQAAPLPAVKKSLQGLRDDGLIYMDYAEHRNDVRILSFTLDCEWTAAYPTAYQLFFVFDKVTKKKLTLDSLLLPQKRSAFRTLLKAKHKAAMNTYRAELKKWVSNSEVDSTDAGNALEQMKADCFDHYRADYFQLYKDNMEVVIEYHLMHALRALSSLLLPVKEIRGYLKPEYRN